MCLSSGPSYTPAAAPAPAAAVAPPPVLQTSVNEANNQNGLAAANRKGVRGLRIDRNASPGMGGVGGGTGLNIANG